MKDSIFIYYWYIDEKDEEMTKIRAYGLDKNNKNVCLIINDFTPYVYLELPSFTQWNERKAQLLGNKLDEELRDYGPIKKSLIMKHKLYGAHIDSDGNRKKFPYLFCSFAHKNHITRYLIPKIRRSINVQGIGNIKMKVHEGDADPILQLVCCRNIPSVGWIKFIGEEVSEHDKVTLAEKEYEVSWKGLYNIENDSVGLPLIMGFDIEVNSCNPTSMPKAKNPGDKVFQISCVFNREGSSESEYYLLTLAQADASQIGDNVKVICCGTEAKLLTSFTELVREKNPNIITGYNILGFDIEYMINRAKFNYCISSFDKLGFHSTYHSQEKKIKWSSSAYKNQEFSYLEAEGRIIVDLLPLIQRDYKFNNYTLKTVSQEILKDDAKIDLSISRMFKLYKIGTQIGKDGKYSKKSIKAMSIIGKYCTKDSELCVKLMQKMQTWIGLTEFAKTCIAEGEYITINNKSVPIETLINHKDILSWNDKSQGLIFNKQINFLDQGTKECIKIYFENGTTLTCTEDHKILNKTGYWIEAGNLKVGERIKYGLQFPKQNILDDIKICNNYNFHVGDFVYNTNNCEEYEKSLAFFRILGWLLTDGSNNLNIERSRLYIGHKLDVETVLQDIYLLTKKNVKPYKEEHNFVIELPAILTKNINKCGIIRGKKSENPEKFLDFIMEENFPLPLLREFLGGLFGGDGHTLKWNSSLKNKYREFDTVKFTRSKIPKLEENLKKWFADLRILLLRFDIKTTINSYIRKKNISIVLTVLKEDCIKFYECISFRYSVHKIQKLFIGCSYFKYKTEIIRQRNWVIEKTKKYIQNGLDKESARLKARDDLIEIEPIINEYSIPTQKQMKCFLNPSRVVKSNRIKFSNNPIHILTFYNYLQNIDGLKFFNDENNNISYGVSKDSISIETINLKIIDIRKVGIKKVYDITVDNDHSFLANGIVCHNCNTGIFSLYTQGQQIKVYSQVYKFCLKNNIVVEKDGYVTKEGERYAGAHVFPPVPGIYDRVLPFDFSSLYPTCMIAYNIDYSTLVMDENIPDSKCNVMKISDHFSCIVEDSIITSNGFSFPIQLLRDNNNLILSHSKTSKLLEYKKQINFFNQGEKDCVELTFEDGSVLKCTPDHKIMTTDNSWINAENIKINITKIKKSIIYPETIFKDYISDYEIKYGDINFTMDNINNIQKTLKFCKILGFLVTDGTIQKNRATCFVGDIVDANCMCQDIFDICGEVVKPVFRISGSSTYYVRIPYSIHISKLWEIDNICGDKMKKDSILPTFITHINCPKIIKREFLAGMFGGDGITINYCEKTKNYSTVGLTKSKYPDRLENLKDYFKNIQKILLEDFNINSYLTSPSKKEKSFNIVLKIVPNDLIKFNETIGFKYCTYKSFKLSILCSYKKLINNVFEQRQRCVDIIKNIKKKEKILWDEAIIKGHEILKNTEPIFNNYYSLPNKHAIQRILRDPNKKTFWSQYFPSFFDYITNLGVKDVFINNEISSKSSIYAMDQHKLNDIPFYQLRVIDIKNIGKHNVYDIEIEDNHSFLANGVVVHNCEHDPKVIRVNELIKIVDNKKKYIKELRAERDKKSNKLLRQEFIDEINLKLEELQPFINERAKIKKTILKNPLCGDRCYKFYKGIKGVIPTILQDLLDARKNTRKQMKNSICKDENCKYIAQYGIDKPIYCIIHKESQHNKLIEDEKVNDIKILNNVLEKRQLAYKISANSIYGSWGVQRGYLPFMPGAMCLDGESQISFSFGFTRKMKDLINTDSLWSYNNGQVMSNGKGLKYNGKKEVIKITLIDGRTLRCTPDHKIMTINGWVEAGKLLSKHNWDGETFSSNTEYSKVIVGLELPEDIIGDDEKNWKLLNYTMDTSDNREKTLAFCRILGFILSDGTISSYKNKYNKKIISSIVSIGTLLDSQIFVKDIKNLTNFEPKITNCERTEIKGNTFSVHIPKILVDQILLLEDIPIGKRSHQPYILPKFLFEKTCPLSVIREFLGGLFGGDGCSPSLSVSHPSFAPIQLQLTTIEKYKENMYNTMNNLINLLDKFSIKFWCMNPVLAREREEILPKDIKENPRWEYKISTNSCNTLLFAQKIGFRYCSDKNNKLSIASSYQRYSDNVRKQHIDIVLKTSDMFDKNDKKLSINFLLQKARKELFENNFPLHEYISLSKSSDINNHRSRPHSLKNYRLLQKYFLTAREYAEMAGCDHWFSETQCSKKVYSMDRMDTISPCFNLDIVDVRYDGIDDVYDILDVQNHSFMANGVVVHNCTTYMGRTNIEIVAKTIQEKYGGKLVYGDKIRD